MSKQIKDDFPGKDTRIGVMAKLAADSTGGGPPFKKGQIITVIHRIKKGRTSVFVPRADPIALSLHIILENVRRSNQLYKYLKFQKHPSGQFYDLPEDQTQRLYDYFQVCMVSIVFCFQAIESLANKVLGETYKPTLVKRRRFWIFTKYHSKEEVLKANTYRKISEFCPFFANLPDVRGSHIYRDFRYLNKIRNKIVHLDHQKVFGEGELDDNSMFYEFLNREPKFWLKATVGVTDYLLQKSGRSRNYDLIREKIQLFFQQ